MVWHLPIDSATTRELSGGWTDQLELAAVQAEITYEVLRTQLAVGGVKRHRLPPALHIPRPQSPSITGRDSRRTDAPRRHATTPGEVLAVLRAGFG